MAWVINWVVQGEVEEHRLFASADTLEARVGRPVASVGSRIGTSLWALVKVAVVWARREPNSGPCHHSIGGQQQHDRHGEPW